MLTRNQTSPQNYQNEYRPITELDQNQHKILKREYAYLIEMTYF